jgi:LppP/LprE lipoprotein
MRRAVGTKTCVTFALAATILAATFAVCAAGCGGGTKTVTVSSAPIARSGTSSTAPRAAPTRTSSTASTATTPTTTSGGGAGAAPTRTAPEPAFAQHGGTASGAEATGEEAAAAVAAVKAHGYTPDDVSEYHPNQTLRVLLGTRTGSADGYEQRAFFFLDGKYLGTDSSAPSASMRVVSQSDTEVVLAYALYRPHDPLCCGTGGQATVHFQLNDGHLVPLQPIPPVSSASGVSRQ